MPQSVPDAIRPPATNMSQIYFFIFFGKVSFLECSRFCTVDGRNPAEQRNFVSCIIPCHIIPPLLHFCLHPGWCCLNDSFHQYESSQLIVASFFVRPIALCSSEIVWLRTMPRRYDSKGVTSVVKFGMKHDVFQRSLKKLNRLGVIQKIALMLKDISEGCFAIIVLCVYLMFEGGKGIP